MKPLVIHLNGDAAEKSNLKKLEKTIRSSGAIPKGQPIEFVIAKPSEDTGEVKRSKRGGVDGG